MRETAVVVRRIVRASPARVFEAWTDPALLGRWMSPVGHAVAEVDLRIGGSLRVVMVGDGRRIEHVGEYIEIDPPRRLVFTWRSQYTGEAATRVTVELKAHDQGTDLTLRHELLSESAAESHAEGWGAMLGRLRNVLAGSSQEVAGGA